MCSASYQLACAMASCRHIAKLKRQPGEFRSESWLPVSSPTWQLLQDSPGQGEQEASPQVLLITASSVFSHAQQDELVKNSNLQRNPNEAVRNTCSYFVQPEAAPIGGNSSRLLRFSWLGGDLAETRGTSLRFLLPPLHEGLSFFPSSSSARERPRSRGTCQPEALTALPPFLLPLLAGRASGVAVRKLPRLAFWDERLSLWLSTGLYPKLGLLLEAMLGKSLQGLDRFDPEKEEEPLDAAAGEKLVSVVQEVTEVLWEKSCTRLLVAWPALLSDPVLWLPWALELGVLAGVEGPLVRIWLVCSLKKFSRKGTKSFWSKLRDTSLSWMWFSCKERAQSINIKMLPDTFFSLIQ